MFPVNRLTEKNSVNRFSINRIETDNMSANLVFCKSRFICFVDDTDLTLNGDADSFIACTNRMTSEMSTSAHHHLLVYRSSLSRNEK